MSKNFLSTVDVRSLAKTIKEIPFKEEQQSVFVNLLKDYYIDADLIKEFYGMDFLDQETFSKLSNLTLEVIEDFPDLFSKNDFLEAASNPILICKKEFRDKFSISEEETIEYLKKIREINLSDFLKINLISLPIDICAIVIQKSNIKNDPVAIQAIDDCKKYFGEAFSSNKYIIQSHKFKPSIEDIKTMVENSAVNFETFLIALQAGFDYPEFVEYLLKKYEPLKDFKDDTPLSKVPNFAFLCDKRISENHAARALSVLWSMNPNPEIISSNFFRKFILSRNDLREESALVLVPLFDALLGYELSVKYAYQKEFKKLLLSFSFADNDDFSI